MMEVEETRGEKVYGPDSMCVAVARMGQEDELIKTCTLKEMCNIDMGGPLHSMVLVGETHPLENDTASGRGVAVVVDARRILRASAAASSRVLSLPRTLACAL